MPSGTADEVIRFEGWRLDVVRRQLVSTGRNDWPRLPPHALGATTSSRD
jgi:hypothetical protein